MLALVGAAGGSGKVLTAVALAEQEFAALVFARARNL